MGFLVNFAKSIEGIFSPNKEKLKYPSSKFGLIQFTEVAKRKGIFDDSTKEINLFENGQIVQNLPYSESEVKALRELGIPVEEEKMDTEEKFQFDNGATFGEVIKNLKQ